MNPGQKWDGPIQDVIREHDRSLGHGPKAGSVATLLKACCNPRPWHPICVDCPGRFRTTSTNLESSNTERRDQ